MDPEHEAERARILAECDALPDDAEAQAIAQAIRGSGRPDTPFAAQMRHLLSEYALSIIDRDPSRQSELAQAIRMMIASGFAQGSDSTH